MHPVFSVQQRIRLGLVLALCAYAGTARAQVPPIEPLPVSWLPDLVAKMGVTGKPRNVWPGGTASPYVQAPIAVGVANQGLGAAGTFKVGVEYRLSSGGPWYGVPFTVPGQPDRWFPWTTKSLAPGGSVQFDGVVTFPSALHNVRVDLRATADSCAGDEFMAASCRVRESNETNNSFVLSGVYLP